MKGATKIKNLTRLRAIQLERRRLLEEIEQCKLGIELSLNLSWPKSYRQENFCRAEIARLRDEIRHLDRKSLALVLPPVSLRECAA